MKHSPLPASRLQVYRHNNPHLLQRNQRPLPLRRLNPNRLHLLLKQLRRRLLRLKLQ